MAETPNVANLTAIALTQSVITFVTLLPDPATLKDETSAEYAAAVRTREITAVTLSMLVGIGISMVARSPQPFLFSLLSSAALTAGSEYLLNQGRTI